MRVRTVLLSVLLAPSLLGCGDRSGEDRSSRADSTKTIPAGSPAPDYFKAISAKQEAAAAEKRSTLQALRTKFGSSPDLEEIVAFAKDRAQGPIVALGEEVSVGDMRVTVTRLGEVPGTIRKRKFGKTDDEVRDELIWGVEISVENTSPGRVLRPVKEVDVVDNWGNSVGQVVEDAYGAVGEASVKGYSTQSDEILPGKSAHVFVAVNRPKVENFKILVVSLTLGGGASSERTYQPIYLHTYIARDQVNVKR